MPVFLLPIVTWLGKLGAKVWLYVGLASGAIALFFMEYEAVEHKGEAKAEAKDAVREAKASDQATAVEGDMAQASAQRPATATALEAQLDKGDF